MQEPIIPMTNNITEIIIGMEKYKEQQRYHLNLYGMKNGKEILFTKDHIIPKAKGGKNTMDNYQTMCAVCNREKADN